MRSVLSQGRAAVYEEPIGPAGVRLREVPRTEPAPGTVTIAIRASSINHLDLFLAQGLQRDVKPPRVIAADGAGVVEASTTARWKAGVAVAAVRIARPLGARVFATSRSEDKRKKAVEIGAEAAFDSADFSKAVREATGGGVDVVFEHVGPATLQESMRSLVMGGRIV